MLQSEFMPKQSIMTNEERREVRSRLYSSKAEQSGKGKILVTLKNRAGQDPYLTEL
jgi:hypothetical protein